MMKSSPGATFVVIQTEVILAALEVLFDLPTGTAQAQATGHGRRLLQMGQVDIIRLGFIWAPLPPQPSRFERLGSEAQCTTQENLNPGQTGLMGAAVRRLPSRSFVLGWTELLNDFPQAEGLRLLWGDVHFLSLPDKFYRLSPSFVLLRVYLHKEFQASFFQGLAKRLTVTVNTISQDRPLGYMVVEGLIDQLKGNLGFGRVRNLLGNASLGASDPIAGPTFGQEQARSHRCGDHTVAGCQLNVELAIGVLADRTAILLSNSHRVTPLFDPSRLVHNPALNGFKMGDHFAPNPTPDQRLIPGAIGHKLLQTLR